MKFSHAPALFSLSILLPLIGCGGGSSNSGAIGSRTASIQDLGSLLSGPAQLPNLYARAINNRGQVVGYTLGTISHAFVWQNGKMTDLGTLGVNASYSRAIAINDQGVIVGTSLTSLTPNAPPGQSYTYDQACRFTIGGEPQALPVSTGSNPAAPLENTATGINNAGQICGTAPLADAGLQITSDLAYTLTNGKLLAASPTPGGYAGSAAVGINASGQICGTFQTFSFLDGGGVGGTGGLSGGASATTGAAFTTGDVSVGTGTAGKAFLRSASQNAQSPYRRIPLMNRALIESRSAAAGRADASLPAVYPHAFIYSKGAFTDLGGLAGGGSQATAINDAGQVVGFSAVAQNVSHAFVWRSGTLTDIGTLGGPFSQANAIAPNGDVVGGADTATVDTMAFSANSLNGVLYVQHAFLWRNSKLTDLNTLLPANSGWVLQEATGINGKGQIVGYGTNKTPGIHSFLLTL